MMRLKVAKVGSGLHPSEAVVVVKTTEGTERLVVSQRSIQENTVAVGYPIGRENNRVLVELPRETQSGAWRVWVEESQLEPERMRA